MNVILTPPEPPGRTILKSSIVAVHVSGAPAPGVVVLEHADGTIEQLTLNTDYIHFRIDNQGGEP